MKTVVDAMKTQIESMKTQTELFDKVTAIRIEKAVDDAIKGIDPELIREIMREIDQSNQA